MKRPTISLHLIVKNEKHNLPPLFESVKDCFDEIHVTDTGSVDGTIELLQSWGDRKNPANTPVHLHHFKWCDDFSAARNASFEPGTCEFKMWLDADDALQNREAFIKWRDTAMGLSDYWFAVYHYGFDKNKNPIVSFIRERAVRWGLGFKWRDFVHEGINPAFVTPPPKMNHIGTWTVAHRRSESDLAQDRSRNLALFERNKDKMTPRLKYYHGKELFEAGQIFDAVKVLVEAVADPQMEIHDRTLGIQYAAFGLLGLSQFEKAIQLAHQGLQLAPERAEFFVLIGDAYVKMNAAQKAIPMYMAASECAYHDASKPGWGGAIFSAKTCYTDYPHSQLGRIYAQMGQYEKALHHFNKAANYSQTKEAWDLVKVTEDELKKNKPTAVLNVKKTDDIVISCHPGTNLYEWDEQVLKERGIGGSETAAVHLAHHLARLTNRKVKVFNYRTAPKTFGNVEYISNGEVVNYFYENDPKLHISWRHTVKKGSNQVVWCHDLITPGIDKIDAKIAVLSPFHRDYASAMQGVDPSKMFLTRNGIDPTRFELQQFKKDLNTVIFSSSPDRGLEHCINILEIARKTNPAIQFHCFYGFENMRKFGMAKEADRLEGMIKERDWVHFHGNVTQKELTEWFQKSAVWLYPADFIETSCITALEAALTGCRGVGRSIGALPYTMGQFKQNIMLDEHPRGNEELYAKAVLEQLNNPVPAPINPHEFSWESVAKQWIKEFDL
ncbi:glycosyltransferase [Microcystis sp. M061S2]|uniref:glycosyltransferase n=1 Tax=Microcystis sp. M061S2 TaxID=2771171 RepID=UPI002588D909|nr:glycosyltransferase [Microcystis sp. M061S2]MCA2654574.1 glycosyltransferase [Microcystis sp. M061S2]